MTFTLTRRPRLAGAALAAGVVIALGAGCVDLTETPITGITSDFYASNAGFESAVNASYSGLRDFYGQERGMTMTVFGTDEYTAGADGGFKQFDFYTSTLNGDASYIRDSWADYYQSINTQNTVITRAPAANVTEALRATRVAEARFLRALNYFHLVRFWGDVPLVTTETVSPTTEATRAPKADVYKQIVADLQFAESNLPDVQAQYGRVTRPAARHLLSLVYLTRAGPGDFALAADKAKLVIATPGLSLVPRYRDIFDFGNQKNSEVIFSVQYTADPLSTGPGNTAHLYFIMGYELLPGVRRDIANGRPFKRFRPTNFLLNLWDRSKDTRYEDMMQVVWYANAVGASSIPKDASGTPKFAVGDTAIYLPGFEVTAAERAARPYLTVTPSQYTDATFPSLNKFIDPFRLTVNEARGSRNFIVMRLAETYLIAAEALMRDGRSAEAVPFVNAVRTRAAKPGQAAAMAVTAAQLDIDFMLDERARELTGEQMRWFDLVRTGKLVERVTKYNPKAAANIQPY
ncbi:MAG: RagB/SusD family nutrient uptake outer membrane protein, partial [Gemmatimonadaceae bacterium]|nr:RagB/SusD family nutrient uptake outer membrane protein [Gemmatimonadaceae bacterium]